MARPRTAQSAHSELDVRLMYAAPGAWHGALGSESCRYIGYAVLDGMECYAMRSARPPSR
ncbi:hypothetical protein XbrCFBP1976_13510 [Xanthomonas bromi]|uniref:Uncharacterized protein n=1 Tax=Xanthomonas bromi TaxID=56449 RepID=A0ABX5BP15_9XANT|nr:hypothetical protein XbrCFBP1976_13510 [Xanthomonas bromi]